MTEQIPSSIVQAICKIKANMAAVSKENDNRHGGYKYTSADDIYAALSRKMGDAGLLVLVQEDFCEIKRFEGKDGKPVQWAHMVFSFILATPEATWTDAKACRTLYIQVTGAQTFQAAQSYVEKAYLRSLFKIPTGDLDLDSLPQAANEDDMAKLTQPRKPKSSAQAKRDGTNETFNDIVRNIQSAATVEILEQIPVLFADEVATLPQRWHDLYEGEYETRM